MSQSLTHRLVGLKAQLSSQAGMESLPVRWGIVLILCIVFWAGVIEPYIEWRNGRLEGIRIQSEKMIRLQALEASSQQWKKAYLTYTKATSSLPEGLFEASSSAGAQAALLQLMRQWLNKYHLQLNGQSFVNATIEPDVGERVGVRLRLRGSLENLLALMDNLSRQKKIIVMDQLDINRFGEAEYALQLQVSGFWLARNSP